MKELKTQEELQGILDFYKEKIISVDTSYTENEKGISGFSSVGLIPVIQLHSDLRNIKDLFYTAYGKALEKLGNGNMILVMCNNEELEDQLKKREGFTDLGFKILEKEV